MEARKQFIERDSELAQLVARVGDGQLLAKVLRPDPARAPRHSDHWRKTSAREKPPAATRQEKRRQPREEEGSPEQFQFDIDRFERLADEYNVGNIRRRNLHSSSRQAMASAVVLIHDGIKVNAVFGYRTQARQALLEIVFGMILGEQPSRSVEDQQRLF